jgi:hypothetical protein
LNRLTFKPLGFYIFEQITELSDLRKKQLVGFIKLLSDNFDIKSFIPESFTPKYYANLGRDRKYELSSVLSALILILPTTVVLNLFLIFSTEIREFCCFYDDIPHGSFFSRLKNTFESDIADLFNSMVPHTIDICDDINKYLLDDSPYRDGNSNLILFLKVIHIFLFSYFTSSYKFNCFLIIYCKLFYTFLSSQLLSPL